MTCYLLIRHDQLLDIKKGQADWKYYPNDNFFQMNHDDMQKKIISVVAGTDNSPFPDEERRAKDAKNCIQQKMKDGLLVENEQEVKAAIARKDMSFKWVVIKLDETKEDVINKMLDF